MVANGLGFAAAGAAAEFASPRAVIVVSGLAGLLTVTLLARRPITANLQQAARRIMPARPKGAKRHLSL
jgi:hypothetical protein